MGSESDWSPALVQHIWMTALSNPVHCQSRSASSNCDKVQLLCRQWAPQNVSMKIAYAKGNGFWKNSYLAKNLKGQFTFSFCHLSVHCLHLETWGELENLLYFCYLSSASWCLGISSGCNTNVGLCTAGPWHHSLKALNTVHFPCELFSSRRVTFSINRTWEEEEEEKDCQVSSYFHVNSSFFTVQELGFFCLLVFGFFHGVASTMYSYDSFATSLLKVNVTSIFSDVQYVLRTIFIHFGENNTDYYQWGLFNQVPSIWVAVMSSTPAL